MGHKVIPSEVKLRPAMLSDSEMVLGWRNEPTTFLNMKTKRPLRLDEHESWFQQIVYDPKCIFLIIEVRGTPVGQIRYDLDCGIAKVSINITKEWHGKGVSSIAFLQGSRYLKKIKFVESVFARVLPTNVGSIKAMQNAGYKIIKEITYEGEPHYYMTHDITEIII